MSSATVSLLVSLGFAIHEGKVHPEPNSRDGVSRLCVQFSDNDNFNNKRKN